jgi:hypothetical protein
MAERADKRRSSGGRLSGCESLSKRREERLEDFVGERLGGFSRSLEVRGLSGED